VSVAPPVRSFYILWTRTANNNTGAQRGFVRERGPRRMITARNFWFWFGGIWFAVGALFLTIGVAVGMNHGSVEKRLAAAGRDTAGVVLTREIASPSNGSRSYHVTFRFDTASGETIRGSAELEPAAWDALAERGPIAVTYLPERPGTYRVPGQTDSDVVLTLVMGSMGAALTAVGGFLLLSAFRRRNRDTALERHGTLTPATVLGVAPGNLRINGVPQWRLEYRFRDGQGRTHDGSCSLSPHDAHEWKQGQVGRVRYDSRNPRDHVWVGRG
jgi:hypothetical protein